MNLKPKMLAAQISCGLLLVAGAPLANAESAAQFRPMGPPPADQQYAQQPPNYAPPAQQQQPQSPPPNFAPQGYGRSNNPPPPPAAGRPAGPPPGYQPRGPYGPPPGYAPRPQQGAYGPPPGYGGYPPPPPPPRGNRSRSWNDGPSGWFKGNRKPWRGDNPWDFWDMDDPKDSMSRGWDDMLNAPSRMGEMPGGWYAPEVSVPNPVDVGEEFGDAVKDAPDQFDNMRKE